MIRRIIFYCVGPCLQILAALLSTNSIAQSTLEREIEMDLDVVEGAKKYEIRISDPTGLKPPVTQTIQDTHFLRKVGLGKWKFEVRSFDKRGVAGRWNDLGTIEVGFKAPLFKSPTQGQVIAGSSQNKTPTTVKWTSFSSQAKYQVKLTKEGQDKPILDQTTSATTINAKLSLGQYTVTLKSIVPEGTPLDGKDPEPLTFTIKAGKLATPEVASNFPSTDKTWMWKPVKDAKSYSFTLIQTKDESGKPIVSNPNEQTFNTNKPEASKPNDLAPGTYQVLIVAKADYFDDSDAARSTVLIPKPEVTPPKPPEPQPAKESTPSKTANKKIEPNHVPVDFIQGTMGPVFWQYSFNSTSGQNFNLFAGTLTAISADANRWFAKTPTSAWAAEVRGRQTNVYLFENGDSDIPSQTKVSVADRRIALIARKRKIINRVGIDAIFGLGHHHYTYLTQNLTTSVISPVEGNLIEYYIGGALDWQIKNGSHLSFDMTFHPVSQAVGISADQTWQYTSSLKYMRRLLHDRSYLSTVLENFRSRVNTHNLDAFEGEAETISTWYRFGLGLAFKI
jgi:hypothetical protein